MTFDTKGFLLWALAHIFWPFKGLASIEAYVLNVAKEILKHHIYARGAVIFVILAIVIALAGMDIIRAREVRHLIGRGILAILRRIAWAMINIWLAWVYLGIGTLNGRMDDSHQPPRIVIRNGHLTVVRDSTAIHYQVGRWLYRRLSNLLGLIPVLGSRDTLRAGLARAIASFICFWGIWNWILIFW